MKKALFPSLFIFACALFLVSCGSKAQDQSNQVLQRPASFEACLIAGGKLTKSRPRQCSIRGKTYAEDLAIGKIGDKRNLLFQVGPEKVDCTGSFPTKCLIVNGQYFYAPISGFMHKPGVTSIIEVERLQYCNPKVFNSCPQDVGIYRYRLLAVIEEK